MKKTKIFFIILIIFLILVSPVKKAIDKFVVKEVTGVERLFSSAGRKTQRFFATFFNISNLKEQNEELSDKILSFEVDRSKIAELEYENELLKKELGYMSLAKDYSVVPARIIGREPTSFLDEITIDMGEKDGVHKDAGVISGGALVGQVKETSYNQSKVTLITSKDSLVMAMLQKSREKGILKGGISGLILSDITSDVQYGTGDYIVTSGLDGQLKEGILIGKAGSLQSSTSELFKNISVEPAVDLSKLEIVFVIK